MTLIIGPALASFVFVLFSVVLSLCGYYFEVQGSCHYYFEVQGSARVRSAACAWPGRWYFYYWGGGTVVIPAEL